jgi:hypothetical protein
MAIVPEDKDWTWVLARRCPDCAFDAASFDPSDTGDTVRSIAARWVQVLDRRDVRTRPDDATWSPLEYAGHVRDVFRLFDHRLERMLTEDDPLFANWDQDATAIEERYNEQDPATIAAEIVAAGDAIARRFDGVQGDQWARSGRRSDDKTFSVDTFARYFVHDPLHHLWDVAG